MRRFPAPPWLLAVLLALPPAAAALHAGLPATVDGGLHLQRTLSVAYLLRAAPGWPRWAPHFLQGWGYPIHNFYPPGVPLLAAAAVNAGLRPEQAHLAIIAAAWSLASAGTYRLARTALPPSGALLAAGAAAFSAVRLFEVQVQGNMPQLVAAAIVPWALACTVEAVRRPGVTASAALAASVAAIALVHHVTFVLALGALALVAAVVAAERFDRRRERPDGRRALAGLSGAGALAFGLAAVYLVPAALDAPRVQLAKAASGMFDPLANLVAFADLARPLARVDRGALAVPFTHGWGPAAAVLALAGIAAALRPDGWAGGDRRRAVGLIGAGALTALPALTIAAPYWRTAPFVAWIQFPWRLLAIAEPCLAVAVGAALLWLPERRRGLGLAAGLALLGVAAAPWLPPIATAAPLADPTARAAVAAERIPNAPPGTTSSLEYLPSGARPDLGAPPSDAALAAYAAGRWWIDVDRPHLPADLAADVVAVGAHGSAIVLGPGAAVDVRLRQLWFPGWRGRVDGRPIRLEPGADGILVAAVPASVAARRLVVTFAGDAAARWSGRLSGVLWLCLIALAAARIARGRASAAPASEPDLSAPARRRLAAGLLVAAVAAATLLGRWRWLAPHSPATSPAAMRRPVHAVLGDADGPAVELIGVDVPDRARPGMDVRLYWRALRPLERRYRPFVQIVTLATGTMLANDTATDPGGRPTRDWPLDRFVIDAHRLDAPAAATVPVARLVAGLFDDDTGRRLTTSDGGDAVALGAVRLASAIPAGAPASSVPTTRFGDAIRLVGARAEPAAVAGERFVRITLLWRVDGAVDRAYTVFRHVDGASAPRDGPPAGGDAPTDVWRAGDAVVDVAMVPLGAGRPAPATVAVGLYAPDSGARLPAVGPRGRWTDDAVVVPVTPFAPPE